MTNGDDRAIRVAKLLARLVHRLADRESVLELGGLTDESFQALETEVVAELLHAPAGELAAFATEFLKARADLLGAGAETRRAPAAMIPDALMATITDLSSDSKSGPR